MKRCPECRRDYYDDTLSFCLEDGTPLVYGVSPDEPATAILSEPPAVAGGLTRSVEEAEANTAILQPPATAGGSDPYIDRPRGFDKRLLALPLLLAIIVPGGFFGYRYFKPAASEQINSIAVLPFENRSGNADTDYLSDGLADSLIYRLSQLPSLKVSPTSSVMRYRGKDTDVAQIAKELEVDAVMSGRLTQRGDDLSISVQLIDSRTKKLIWAEQYDRKMSDLLATQREIATTITQKLQLKLAGAETKGITKKYTDNNEAYQLYLKGRYHFAKRTKDDVLKSIEYFQQAIRVDPNFALAYARIAEAYNQMPNYPYLSPNEAFPQAKAAARRALEIDPTLAEAHAALANTLTSYDWNWTEAESEFKRALESDPNSAGAHYRYATEYLLLVGRNDEAIAEVKHALEIEPLDLNMVANLARVYLYGRHPDMALEQARKAHDLEPNFVIGRFMLGMAYNGNGLFDDAIRLSEKSLQTEPANQHMLWVGGYAYAKSGRRREAEEAIKNFREIAKTQYVIPSFVASIYGALGDKDKAFAELEKALEQRDSWVKWIKVDPMFDPLRDDPRFKDLIHLLGLPR
jgi:TolB-like protein/Flp pilus assembly protein TadD